MPHWNPRLNPSLEVARPADIMPGTFERPGEDEPPWDALFGDGQWRHVRVLAWFALRRGGRAVQVEYFADGSGWIEEYAFDPERMRESDDCDG